eukprot:6460932-Amphidinium_carterae.1
MLHCHASQQAPVSSAPVSGLMQLPQGGLCSEHYLRPTRDSSLAWSSSSSCSAAWNNSSSGVARSKLIQISPMSDLSGTEERRLSRPGAPEQEATIPLTHWPSVAGEYVASQPSQKARLEYARLDATKERQKASKEGWEKFVKEAAEDSPSKLFQWVRGSTKVWDLAVQTTDGWAASPGAVAESELRAWGTPSEHLPSRASEGFANFGKCCPASRKGKP